MKQENALNKHLEVNGLLEQIKNECFDILKNKKISEYWLQQEILKFYRKNKLKTTKERPIVAFGKNTSIVHYYAKKGSKKTKIIKNGPVLIDIWAVSKGYYGDITWTGWKGNKIDKEFLKIFNIVINARDKGINYIKNCLKRKKLPSLFQIDKIVRDYIKKKGYGKYFLHSTGHSLGKYHVHGKGYKKNWKKKIKFNQPYTIEPGIYIKNKFGARSEIDFYAGKNYELNITSKIQKKLIKI